LAQEEAEHYSQSTTERESSNVNDFEPEFENLENVRALSVKAIELAGERVQRFIDADPERERMMAAAHTQVSGLAEHLGDAAHSTFASPEWVAGFLSGMATAENHIIAPDVHLGHTTDDEGNQMCVMDMQLLIRFMRLSLWGVLETHDMAKSVTIEEEVGGC